MTTDSPMEPRRDAARAILEPIGQTHLLRWWDDLADAQRVTLLDEIESVPWPVVGPLIDTHVRARPAIEVPESLAPAPVYPQQPDDTQKAVYREARARGESLLADGKVAAFTVAGGQGSRLGFDGPKGAVPVTPVGDRTLFELFAAMVVAASRRYGAPIPWYVMTSPANHEATHAFLAGHGFFGLPEDRVRLFPQAMLPAFDFDGRALLAEKHRIALAPDGHGGSLTALVRSGNLDDMRTRGIELISYFQVDNPLVQPFDPLFIGLHAHTKSEMSTKVAPKADDLERVGNVCLADGRLTVIEYSDFPEALARKRDAAGRRMFNAGNLAIHMIDTAFVDRIVGGTDPHAYPPDSGTDRCDGPPNSGTGLRARLPDSDTGLRARPPGEPFTLPYRRAEKAVAFVDDRGRRVSPEKPNAVKLETFVFDALPLARAGVVLEVDRAEEFSPVKNAAGVDSLESSRRDQCRRAGRWLERAGVRVARNPDGTPAVTVGIDPRFALDPAELAARKDQIPPLTPGVALWIE